MIFIVLLSKFFSSFLGRVTRVNSFAANQFFESTPQCIVSSAHWHAICVNFSHTRARCRL